MTLRTGSHLMSELWRASCSTCFRKQHTKLLKFSWWRSEGYLGGLVFGHARNIDMVLVCSVSCLVLSCLFLAPKFNLWAVFSQGSWAPLRLGPLGGHLFLLFCSSGSENTGMFDFEIPTNEKIWSLETQFGKDGFDKLLCAAICSFLFSVRRNSFTQSGRSPTHTHNILCMCAQQLLTASSPWGKCCLHVDWRNSHTCCDHLHNMNCS